AQGTGLGNYSITYKTGKLTVGQGALIITATDQSKTYGQTLALGATAFTVSGLATGDTVTGVTLVSDGAVATAAKGNYSITPSAALGTGVGNYDITYKTGTLTVGQGALIITATDQSKTYGQTLALGTTAFTVSGLATGDTVTGVTLTSTGATAAAATGNYDIVPS